MAHILLIEDDPKLALVLKKGLEENHYTVEMAHEGRAGLHAALEKDYEALIIDVMLPGMDGFALVRELRTRKRATPVLMLTARGSIEDRVKGIDHGADDYLTKPFDFRELLARIRAILRRPPIVQDDVLRVADLEVDPASRRALRNGQRIDLTGKEFELLEYLIRNRGRVLTRNMILNRVWNMDLDGGSNVADVYINYLRKKLDQDFEPKLIHTVRGVGYVLREQP